MIEREQFTVAVPTEQIEDLRRRLASARWPDQLPGAGWTYGTDLNYLRSVCRYWATDYDWSAFSSRLNSFPQYLSKVHGHRIHYYDVPAERPDAPVLLLLHGWPGSVTEFLDVIGPLAQPARDEDAADSLHVIVPSLPGYGFSGVTERPGVDVAVIAELLDHLMLQLGHDRYVVHGGDWGALIAVHIAHRHRDHVAALHLTRLPWESLPQEARRGRLTKHDQLRLERYQQFTTEETGYRRIQATKPQTVAYGLMDSPSGLAAWVLEKFHSWTDGQSDPDDAVPRDRLLDNLNVYWFTGTIGSSMRLYYESQGPGRASGTPSIEVPVGHAAFPAEIVPMPRAWAEHAFPIVHWTDMPRGGHFPALEVPGLLVDDLRLFFRNHR